MVVFVVGTGWVAERKGYSFGLFVALGLFLGIIGLIIAFVVPRKKKLAVWGASHTSD